ncbi:MAG: YihY/virulence factor BrkB family protein, partial [Thermoleophilia bacterium]|nr:YihY/virulence factor BrkB family protein [Thermoleophilia bacterium]
LLKRSARQVGEDHVGAYAGNLTYHALFAIFPFAIFILSVLFIGGEQRLLLDGIDNLRSSGALSTNASTVIAKQVTELDKGNQAAFGIGLAVSIATALWAVSGAFRSVMEATNEMYNVKESRSFVKRYVISLYLSIAVAAMFIVALGLLVAGPAVANSIGGVGKWFWLILQWPVLFSLVLVGLAIVYHYAPSVEQKFKWVSMGSLVAGMLWIAFSLLFSLYVNNFGSYNKTYGTLAGAIVLLLYLYYTSFIFLFGAEINQVIEDANPEGKSSGDKHPGGVRSLLQRKG